MQTKMSIDQISNEKSMKISISNEKISNEQNDEKLNSITTHLNENTSHSNTNDDTFNDHNDISNTIGDTTKCIINNAASNECKDGNVDQLSMVIQSTSKNKMKISTSLSRELLDAFYLGTFNALLGYNLRAGFSILLRLFRLLRQRKLKAVCNLRELLDESKLSFRVDAVSIGLFFGWSTGGYRALKSILLRVLKKVLPSLPISKIEHLTSALAGAFASCAVGFLSAKRRRTVALYALTRALQCLYNIAKQRNYWHFWGSQWNYGDSLLFALSSAQIMYAYVMRPMTLPMEYFHFIEKTGPIEPSVLKLVRLCNRSRDTNLLMEAISSVTSKMKLKHKHILADLSYPNFTNHEQISNLIPCRLLHCHSRSCTMGWILTFKNSFVRAYPLYLSLYIVPSVVVHFKRFLSRPLRTFAYCIVGATRSTCFLASFVALYMSSACLQRRLSIRDHRFFYYAAGLIASITVVMEPKSRRSELALYVLPRALDSLYISLNDRRILPSFRFGEIYLYSLSMAVIMHSYEHDKQSVSPLFVSTIKRFLQTATEKKKAYLATLGIETEKQFKPQ